MLRFRYSFRSFAGVWGCAWALLAVGFVLAIARAGVGYVLLIAGGGLTWCLAIPLLLRPELSTHLNSELQRRGYALTSLMVDDPQKMLGELARLGARLIIQRAVEEEFDTSVKVGFGQRQRLVDP